MLEKMGMLKSRREGLKYRAFYVTETKFPEQNKFRFTELQSKILRIIGEKNGVTQKEIESILGEKQQTISYNIKMMQRNGIIRLEKHGRKTHCYLN
jgi:uncharacterized membrane protein